MSGHDHHHGHHAMPSNSSAPNAESSMDNMMNHDVHDTHEMSNSSTPGGHHNMMMHMYFHGGEKETILFEFWKISDTAGLIGSMVAIFVLAFFYEALKFYREHLYRHSFRTVQVNTMSVPAENGGAVKETHKTVQITSTPSSSNPYTPEVTPIFISQSNCDCPPKKVEEDNISEDEQVTGANTNGKGEPGSSCRRSSRTTVSVPPHRAMHYKVSMFSGMHIWQTCLHIFQVVLSYFLMLIFMTYNYWLCLAVAIGAAAGYFFFGWKKSLVVDITEHRHEIDKENSDFTKGNQLLLTTFK